MNNIEQLKEDVATTTEIRRQKWDITKITHEPFASSDEVQERRSTIYAASHPNGAEFQITDRLWCLNDPIYRFVGTSKYEKRVLGKDRTVTYQSHTIFRRSARELLWELDRWAQQIEADKDSPWGWMLHKWIVTKSGKKVYKPGCDDDPPVVFSQHTRDPVYRRDDPECRLCGRTSSVSKRNRNCGNCIKYGTECLEVLAPEDCCDEWATECCMNGFLSKKCLSKEE
jgi:hypothetical protein